MPKNKQTMHRGFTKKELKDIRKKNNKNVRYLDRASRSPKAIHPSDPTLSWMPLMLFLYTSTSITAMHDAHQSNNHVNDFEDSLQGIRHQGCTKWW